MSGSRDREWIGPGLTLLFQAKRVMEKAAQDEESCVQELEGWGGHPLGRGTKGPVPLSLAVRELLRAQPQPSQGSRSRKLPAATSYHPAASTHTRQADEGQSSMKKTKEKRKRENALLRPNQ